MRRRVRCVPRSTTSKVSRVMRKAVRHVRDVLRAHQPVTAARCDGRLQGLDGNLAELNHARTMLQRRGNTTPLFRPAAATARLRRRPLLVRGIARRSTVWTGGAGWGTVRWGRQGEGGFHTALHRRDGAQYPAAARTSPLDPRWRGLRRTRIALGGGGLGQWEAGRSR